MFTQLLAKSFVQRYGKDTMKCKQKKWHKVDTKITVHFMPPVWHVIYAQQQLKALLCCCPVSFQKQFPEHRLFFGRHL